MTKTDRFREFIQREVMISKEAGLMKKWELYEHLKGFIPASKLSEESAVNVIKAETGMYFLE